MERCITVTYAGTVDPGSVHLYAAPTSGDLASYLDLTVDIGHRRRRFLRQTAPAFTCRRHGVRRRHPGRLRRRARMIRDRAADAGTPRAVGTARSFRFSLVGAERPRRSREVGHVRLLVADGDAREVPGAALAGGWRPWARPAALTVVLAQNTTTASFAGQTGDTGNQVSSAATFCTTPGSTTLGPAMDTAVYQATRPRYYGAAVSIGLGSATSANAYSYVKFTLTSAPIPAHCTVTSATLSVYASAPMAGATLYVYRADAAWNAATMTWNTGRVGFTGTPAQTASLRSGRLAAVGRDGR